MFFQDLERQRGEVERHRENSARLAQSFAKFETIGQGYIQFEDVVDFGLTFIEEPFPTYGAACDLDELAELLDLEPDMDPAIPITSGMVTEWDQDDRGFYLGAWVAVKVYYPAEDQVAVDVDLPIRHYFTFAGIALKDIPLDVRD